MGRLANYTVSFITTIVTIVTFAGFVTSKSLETWTKTHSDVIFYGLIFFFMATGASLSYLFEQKRKYRQLKDATARVKPSEHDINLFQNFIKLLPPDGPVIEWLKENFVSSVFLDEHYKGIEAALRNMRLRALEFDNSEAEASYDRLHRAIQKFEDTTLQYMWQDSNSPWIRVPPEWDDKRSNKAIGEISEARLELIEKYDDFLDVAHKGKIDQ